MLRHVRAIGPRHSLILAGLQFEDRAAPDLDRAPVQGRVRDRDKRHDHGGGFAQRKHHAARQVHRDLLTLLDRREQFHVQEIPFPLRDHVPPAHVLALDQFHQVVPRNFQAKRAAIGLSKGKIHTPCDVQTVLAHIDDGQRCRCQRLIHRSRRDLRAPRDFETATLVQGRIDRLLVLRRGLAQHRRAHAAMHIGARFRYRHFHGGRFRVGNRRADDPRTTLTCDRDTNGQFQAVASLPFDQQRQQRWRHGRHLPLRGVVGSRRIRCG